MFTADEISNQLFNLMKKYPNEDYHNICVDKISYFLKNMSDDEEVLFFSLEFDREIDNIFVNPYTISKTLEDDEEIENKNNESNTEKEENNEFPYKKIKQE